MNQDSLRLEIVDKFARWTAFSSTRSGCPLKARKDIYPLLELIDYNEFIEEPTDFNQSHFEDFHEKRTHQINTESRNILGVGWSAKILNVYLKTFVYVGSCGDNRLKKMIHPPIDGGLWDGLKDRVSFSLLVSF